MKTRLLTDAVFGRVSNSYQLLSKVSGTSVITNSPPRSYFWSDLEVQQQGDQSRAKMGDRTALYVKVYQLSTQMVQPHSWMRPAAPQTQELIWLGYNTLTESRLLFSLLSLTLHLYYFVKALSTVILIFYRSEARDYSICFIGPV